MLPTKYASFFKRFVAHIIDVVVAIGIGMLVLLPFALMTAGGEVIDNIFSRDWYLEMSAIPHSILGRLFDGWFGSFAPVSISILVFWILFHTVLYWLYFAVFESSPRQATPGKMMLGLFVTDIHGRRITFGRALGRTLSKILSQLFCWLGYIMALFTPRSQGLHDLIAGTLVLEPAYPAPAVAPPQATPPGPSVPAELANVEIPGEPAPAALKSEQATEDTQPGPDEILHQPEAETDSTAEKPEEQPEEKNSAEDKPEQEKE